MLTKPHLLVSKVLSSKYNFNSLEDISHKRLRGNVSPTWRAIAGAVSVISRGCRWRVGNGEHINGWRDPWIRRPSLFFSISTRQVESSWRVRDFMNVKVLPGILRFYNGIFLNQNAEKFLVFLGGRLAFKVLWFDTLTTVGNS